MKAPAVVKCPTCQRLVEWTPANQYRPFCSERCRLIDLGQWANEAYSVAVTPSLDKDDDIEPKTS